MKICMYKDFIRQVCNMLFILYQGFIYNSFVGVGPFLEQRFMQRHKNVKISIITASALISNLVVLVAKNVADCSQFTCI